MSAIINTTPTADMPNITTGDIAESFAQAAVEVASWDTAGWTAEEIANAISRRAAAIVMVTNQARS